LFVTPQVPRGGGARPDRSDVPSAHAGAVAQLPVSFSSACLAACLPVCCVTVAVNVLCDRWIQVPFSQPLTSIVGNSAGFFLHSASLMLLCSSRLQPRAACEQPRRETRPARLLPLRHEQHARCVTSAVVRSSCCPCACLTVRNDNVCISKSRLACLWAIAVLLCSSASSVLAFVRRCSFSDVPAFARPQRTAWASTSAADRTSSPQRTCVSFWFLLFCVTVAA
jgi:hypothetical protein